MESLPGVGAHAVLHDFVVRVGRDCFGVEAPGDLYAVLNRLAAGVEMGSDGLCCDPCFLGTRMEPGRRGSYTGLSAANFTPSHLARALLEGSAALYSSLYREMVDHVGLRPRTRLIGAGNGIRRNPLLADLLASLFGLPLVTPQHAEEAAFGAALLAAVATGEVEGLASAGQIIRYGAPETQKCPGAPESRGNERAEARAANLWTCSRSEVRRGTCGRRGFGRSWPRRPWPTGQVWVSPGDGSANWSPAGSPGCR